MVPTVIRQLPSFKIDSGSPRGRELYPVHASERGVGIIRVFAAPETMPQRNVEKQLAFVSWEGGCITNLHVISELRRQGVGQHLVDLAFSIDPGLEPPADPKKIEADGRAFLMAYLKSHPELMDRLTPEVAEMVATGGV